MVKHDILAEIEVRAHEIIGPVPTQEDLPDDITALKPIIADMARDGVTARLRLPS
jgi:hypothetical protein